MKKLKKIAIFLVIIITVFFALSACNRESDYSGGTGAPSSSGLIISSSQRKISYNASITLEVNDIDDTLNKINESINNINLITDNISFVAFSERKYEADNAYLEVKVQTTHFEEFITGLEGLGTIMNKVVSTKDISGEYYNAIAEVEAFEREIEMLQALLESTTDSNAAISYTQRISELTKRLSAAQNALNNINSNVELSTIKISIYGPGKAPIKEKFSSQAAKVFFGSLDSMKVIARYILLAIIAVGPYSLIAGAILCAILLPPYFQKKKAEKQRNAAQNIAQNSQLHTQNQAVYQQEDNNNKEN